MGEMAIREIVQGMGLSLTANKKTSKGTAHVERDATVHRSREQEKPGKRDGFPRVEKECAHRKRQEQWERMAAQSTTPGILREHAHCARPEAGPGIQAKPTFVSFSIHIFLSIVPIR
jgi:hypothetical protein